MMKEMNDQSLQTWKEKNYLTEKANDAKNKIFLPE